MINTMRRKMKSRAGFTLVELLVVIVILGVLAGLGLQQFTNVRQEARQTAHESNLRLLKGAAQMAIAFGDADGDTSDWTSGDSTDYIDDWPELDDVSYSVSFSSDGAGLITANVSGEL